MWDRQRTVVEEVQSEEAATTARMAVAEIDVVWVRPILCRVSIENVPQHGFDGGTRGVGEIQVITVHVDKDALSHSVDFPNSLNGWIFADGFNLNLVLIL